MVGIFHLQKKELRNNKVGNIIVDQVQKTRNWPLAASFSVILTAISMIGVIWMMRTSKAEIKNKKDNKVAEETFKKEVL